MRIITVDDHLSCIKHRPKDQTIRKSGFIEISTSLPKPGDYEICKNIGHCVSSILLGFLVNSDHDCIL